MNKTFLFLVLLLFGLVSCEKDESNENDQQTTEEKILGDWRGDKSTFSSNNPSFYEENSLNDYVLKFKNDGTYDVDSLGQFTVETHPNREQRGDMAIHLDPPFRWREDACDAAQQR